MFINCPEKQLQRIIIIIIFQITLKHKDTLKHTLLSDYTRNQIHNGFSSFYGAVKSFFECVCKRF